MTILTEATRGLRWHFLAKIVIGDLRKIQTKKHKQYLANPLKILRAFGQVYEALALPHDNNKDDDDDNNKERKEDGHLLLDRTPTWISRAASEPSSPLTLVSYVSVAQAQVCDYVISHNTW